MTRRPLPTYVPYRAPAWPLPEPWWTKALVWGLSAAIGAVFALWAGVGWGGDCRNQHGRIVQCMGLTSVFVGTVPPVVPFTDEPRIREIVRSEIASFFRAGTHDLTIDLSRSEERRVGKECRL